MRLATASFLLGASALFAACSFPEYDFASSSLEGGAGGDAQADAAGGATSGGAGGQDGATDGASGRDGATDAQPPTDAPPDGPKKCASAADCTGFPGRSVCDPDGACVECVEGKDCPAGAWCTPTRVCEVGCGVDADCLGVPSLPVDAGAPDAGDAGATEGGKDGGSRDAGDGAPPDAGTDSATAPLDATLDAPDATDGAGTPALRCDLGTHTCVGCLADGDCPAGSLCDEANKRCTPGCPPGRPCPVGFLCCKGECFDPSHTPEHCGDCSTDCHGDSGLGACVGGVCETNQCQASRADCNGSASDGCETDLLDDVVHCGSCGTKCPDVANAAKVCQTGSCGMGACDQDFADCDGDRSTTNGCEVNLTQDTGNCGTCGFACNLLNASPACSASTCAIVNCRAGYANCDKLDSTGCEVDTQSDASNCGACGKVCAFTNADATCQSGTCKIGPCLDPFQNCNTLPGDGCEINTSSDPDNCGTCAHICTLSHATAACTDGKCVIATCDPGYGDCDGLDSNGCEVNTNTSTTNCGGCGFPCSTNHGTASCALGACAIQCAQGYQNCDGDPVNGCEVNTTNNVEACGSCTKVCPSTAGTPNCVNSLCGISVCTAPQADCNGLPGDGCEVDTDTSVTNCGGCGKTCYEPNGTTACSNGSCTLTGCNSGFDDCDSDISNGCETRVNTNASCGKCNQPCSLAHAVSTCLTGTCAVASCVFPYADCDGIASNGCETNTSTDKLNCGSCKNACDGTNGTPACTNGSCTIACDPGFGNCNASPSDGCERATRDDVNNCGACGAICAVQNGTAACTGSTCSVASCTAPFADCDKLYATGCEANTDTRIDDCGSCGHVCDLSRGTPTCTDGICYTP